MHVIILYHFKQFFFVEILFIYDGCHVPFQASIKSIFENRQASIMTISSQGRKLFYIEL